MRFGAVHYNDQSVQYDKLFDTMLSSFQPVVAPEIWRQYPDYRALSVYATPVFVSPGNSFQCDVPGAPPRMESHLESWRAAFRKVGANPKKTPCSVEALWKRLQKTGSLPAIDPVVDP
jgi:hypothetical protein